MAHEQLDFFDILDSASTNFSESDTCLAEESESNESKFYIRVADLPAAELKLIRKELLDLIKRLEHQIYDARRTGDDTVEWLDRELLKTRSKLEFLNTKLSEKKSLKTERTNVKAKVKAAVSSNSTIDFDREVVLLINEVKTFIRNSIELFRNILAQVDSSISIPLTSDLSELTSSEDSILKLRRIIRFGYRLIGLLEFSNFKKANPEYKSLSTKVSSNLKLNEQLLYRILLLDKSRYGYSISNIRESSFIKFRKLQSMGQISESQDSVIIVFKCKKSGIDFEVEFDGYGTFRGFEYYSPYFRTKLCYK
jgi:hypothetical protein